MVFRPYVNDPRNIKGFAKKTVAAIYVPKATDVIVKIMEDQFASVFIERNTLRRILVEEAVRLIKEAREYLLSIEASLEENCTIDWYACLMQGRNRAIYYELIKDEIAKEILDHFNEINFKNVIQSVKEMLLDRAMINGEIIVYDKQQKSYLNYLHVHGLRIVKTKIRYDSIVKFCMANNHVIFTFNRGNED